jgi:hypothetical protein
MRLPRINRRRVLVAVATLTLLILLGVPLIGYLALTESEGAEHVDAVSWLPREAGDISYYRSYMFTAYEFSISERGFLAWGQARGWDVKPIREIVTVPRYSRLLRKPPMAMSEHPTEEERSRYDQAMFDYIESMRVSVDDGYKDGRRQGNGGGFIVAYDRRTGRAYYQSNPR